MTAIKKEAGNTAIAPTEKTQLTLKVNETDKKNETPTTQKEPKKPTIEEIKNRATIIHLLQNKHTQLVEKLNSLKRFDVEHDKENVCATIEDASGLNFTSSSPKTIKLVLESWQKDFEDAICETEQKLKDAFNW